MFKFGSKSDVKDSLESFKYISSSEIVSAVYNAVELQSPLLIGGPPGVGKTEIAKVLAKVFDAELIKIQCYEGIDYSKVLYDYNYSKQILYINMLTKTLKDMLDGKDLKESINVLNKETDFFGDEFLLERPVLKAISPKSKNKKVLLIDELDKTDPEFEALLLETLADFSVTIPEKGTIYAEEDNKPLVIITSNDTREISEAIKRRCVYLYIDYPDVATETAIIASSVNINYDFAEKVAKVVANIRKQSLKQKPSISESIAWAKAMLINLGVIDFNAQNKTAIDSTLGVLLKNKGDIEKVQRSNYIIVA